jgi:hypothetical protein
MPMPNALCPQIAAPNIERLTFHLVTRRPGSYRPRSPTVRDLDLIDSELRLLVAVRRVCRELDGSVPPPI